MSVVIPEPVAFGELEPGSRFHLTRAHAISGERRWAKVRPGIGQQDTELPSSDVPFHPTREVWVVPQT